MKDKGSAFCKPCTDTFLLDEELAESWRSSYLPLEKWDHLIATLSNKLRSVGQSEKKPAQVTAQELTDHADNYTKVLHFKTPMKNKKLAEGRIA